MTKIRLSVLCAALLGGAVIATAQPKASLQVQLSYTGSGTVDATHKIFVALWDSADFNSGPPAEVKSTTSKNGAVTFSGITKASVFVSAAYDPTGHWDGASGPPPKGSSLGLYGKTPPTPIAIAPGKPAKVTIAFGDKIKVP